MKWFTKVLLFVFVALIANLKAVNAITTSADIQKATTSFSFHKEIPETDFKIIENDLINTCKSESDLLVYRSLVSSSNAKATKEGLANSRALGIAGEQAVGVGSKTRIPILTGTAKYRIPDQLTSTTLGEVKNVSHLSLTRQLTDFHLYSQQNGLQFILHTRPTTTFSKPLQQLINNGTIIHNPVPGF